MKHKITIYLLTMKLKFIFLTLVLLGLFVQIINLLEVSKIVDSENMNMLSIVHLSSLKLPTTIQEIMPFVIIISTAFYYRHLISNNEFISMRNIGFSIIDIFKPVAFAIFFIGIFSLLIFNPLSSIFQKKFELVTKNDLSSLYSIKIQNNEIWIKNIENHKNNFIKFSDFDLKNMSAKNIKIIEVNKESKNFYLAEKGRLDNKKLILKNVTFFDIDNEDSKMINSLELNVNFNKNDILNSISYYKHIPFYKYKKHLESLKKFNLYSQEISLFYLSEIFKPFFLVILGFVVMAFASKFKRNESFFKILFFSISIGFGFFIFNEILSALSVANYISFWFAYFILIITSFLIGLYQSINIEVD